MGIKTVPSKNFLSTTLDATFSAEATSLTTAEDVSSFFSGVDATNPLVFIIDRVDAGGNATSSKREVCTATDISATTISGITRNADSGGSDQEHAVGAIIEFVPDVLWAQSLQDTFETEHNADGTHNIASTDLTDTADITYNADADVSGNGWVVDEDTMSSNLATKVPTQQSVKAYVDARKDPFVNTTTRDMTTASGTQAITGVGFTPSRIEFKAFMSGGAQWSYGWATATVEDCLEFTTAGAWNYRTSWGIYVESSGGAAQSGTVDSMDADGFTLTWTKAGSPTGTLYIIYTCYP